jgi:hypothetical protein
MAEERSVLRWISWRDCCPWIVLFRAFSISITARALLLATVAGVFVSLGWGLFGSIILDREDVDSDLGLSGVVERNQALPGTEWAQFVEKPWNAPPAWQGLVALSPKKPVYAVWRTVSGPFVQWFNLEHGFRRLAYFFCGGLWTLAVWAFAGGALSRIGVVQLGREERVGLFESVSYARRYFLSYFGGPLFPLILLALFAIPIYILGLIMRLDVGVLIGGLLWLLVILDGVILAFLALGAFFGWPLMWGTISSEGSDAFDSLSRSFAYTFQRPLQYGFYLLVVVLFGALCWMVVSLFAGMVENLTYWAIAWGAGESRINPATIGEVLFEGHDRSTVFAWGGQLVAFWMGCVRAVVASWGYAFFFISMGGVYLLVRRDVDQTEADEVYIEESDETYGMPPLATDEAGVPKAADMPDEKPAPEGPSPDEASDSHGAASPPDDPNEPDGETKNPDA